MPPSPIASVCKLAPDSTCKLPTIPADCSGVHPFDMKKSIASFAVPVSPTPLIFPEETSYCAFVAVLTDVSVARVSAFVVSLCWMPSALVWFLLSTFPRSALADSFNDFALSLPKPKGIESKTPAKASLPEALIKLTTFFIASER